MGDWKRDKKQRLSLCGLPGGYGPGRLPGGYGPGGYSSVGPWVGTVPVHGLRVGAVSGNGARRETKLFDYP